MKKKAKKTVGTREWIPTLSELIDRLSIHQLKEVFIPDHKAKYRKEMKMICNDLDKVIEEKKIKITGEMVRTIVIMAQINAHIWYNESKVRNGEEQDLKLLKLTHGLNGVRNALGNYLLSLTDDDLSRCDYKVDCLASNWSEWEIMIDLGELDNAK